MVAIAGVSVVVCAPALVSAQVRKEAAVPARPDGAAKAEAKKKPAGTTVIVTKESRPLPLPPALKGQVVINGKRVVNGRIEQWTRRFRPILQVEYLFVRTVAIPPRSNAS